MWFKKKKEIVEIPNEEFIAYIYYKDSRIEEIVSNYPSAKEFMNEIVDLMEDRKYWYAMSTAKEFIMITSREVDYITVDKEQNKDTTNTTDNDILEEVAE